MTVRIGLTGPIGCGKSTVAAWLGERGAVVVDADAVVREVYEDRSVIAVVVDRFGDGVRAGDGIDRAALARIVFVDDAALRELEAIVHPAVRPRILAAMDAAQERGAPAVVVEAIKLVEGGLAELCDEVWLVACDAAVQRARVVARGSSEAEAERRIGAQAGLVERVEPVATRRIDTSGPAETTRAIVDRAWREATGRA